METESNSSARSERELKDAIEKLQSTVLQLEIGEGELKKGLLNLEEANHKDLQMLISTMGDLQLKVQDLETSTFDLQQTVETVEAKFDLLERELRESNNSMMSYLREMMESMTATMTRILEVVESHIMGDSEPNNVNEFELPN